MAHYRKGRRFEYHVKHHLEQQGYAVFRCAGSRPVDLVALKPGEPPLLVECKYGKSKLTEADRKALLELARKAGARLILARNDGRRIVLEELHRYEVASNQLHT